MLIELGTGDRSTDPETTVLGRDLAGLADLLDVDHDIRFHQPGAQLHEQIGSTGKNPGRSVCGRQQRHGRIDRIGSKHPRVFLDCFFPAAHLDLLLGLEGRLHAKLSRADAAVGVGEVLPGFDGSAGRVFADTEEQIRQIADEDVTLLLNEGAGNALSGEEYRRRLRRATEPSTLGDDVRRLPYGSGSGFVNEHAPTHGFSFCARIGDNDKPVFRFIPTDDSWNPIDGPDGETVVTRQTLTALSAADPGAEAAERHLPEEAYEAAFDAWAIAKGDIEAEWARLADPKALQPRIPKALRDAVAFVGDHGEFLGNQEHTDLFERLNSVPSHRIERLVREIFNGDHSTRETVELLAGLAERENLQAAPPPPQIDPVHPAEINLVVWMAIAPPTR